MTLCKNLIKKMSPRNESYFFHKIFSFIKTSLLSEGFQRKGLKMSELVFEKLIFAL